MERYYIATLNAVNQVGHQSVKKLVELFGSAENVWRAELSELLNCGINQRAAENLIEFRSKYPDAVEKLVEFCKVKKVKICTFYDEDYPPILKEISGAPVIFYYRGNLKPNVERISIVGTRNATDYGKRVTTILGEELAKAGITIVSGAAKGIDTFAHEAALKFGRTVAVLGYGINKIPRDRRKFFDEIENRGGVVMTEFPPNFEGTTGTFPARNRIIAGLSRGVIVVEAGERSGALITAGFAADSSRDVFVIPHSIFSEKGVGCNNLIRDGATLIKGAIDIFENKISGNYDSIANLMKSVAKIKEDDTFENKKTAPKVELDAMEKLVYDAIPVSDSITLDEILMKVDEIEPSEISEIILKLESKGCIFEDNDRYIRC